MNAKIVLFAAACCWAGLTQADVPGYIKPPHAKQVEDWLKAHPSYRLALESDCQCDDDIESLRKGPGGVWKPEPSYEPYYATGDFNGDGVQDAAVVVISHDASVRLLVVVVFGKPSHGKVVKPAEIPISGSSLANRGLFARAPSPRRSHKPWMLLFGAFESEAEEVPLAPRHN